MWGEDREAEFRSSIKAWYAEMDTVCSALLVLLAAALDVDPAILLDMKKGHASSLNLFSVAADPEHAKTQVGHRCTERERGMQSFRLLVCGDGDH